LTLKYQIYIFLKSFLIAVLFNYLFPVGILRDLRKDTGERF